MRRDLPDSAVPPDAWPQVTPPAQPASHRVLTEKYLRPEESGWHDVTARVAVALARDEGQRRRFLEAMEGGFIPAGRIVANAGTALQATLVNCFVQPIGDSLGEEAGQAPAILDALNQAAQTLRRGGGVGYDFSAIRPQGSPVHASASAAAGPLAFMRLFDALCSVIGTASARQGAQMAVLRCDHPDIESFIQAKRFVGELPTISLCVTITDAFMQAVEQDREFDLVHAQAPPRTGAVASRNSDGLWVWRRLRARNVWDGLIRAAHASGEPGVLFVDTVNRLNNLSYRERIAAINPCGEQPLPPWGACVLGSVDLARVIRHPFSDRAMIDWGALGGLVQTGVELLDRVLDLTPWPLPQQAAQAGASRRIGLGFLGLADALTLLGQRYGSPQACLTSAAFARFLCLEAYRASIRLARQHGAFPAFDAAAFLAPPRFASRLPQDLKDRIARDGIRNSHLLCIAPTGSIALACADNASSGIEPAFAARFTRRHAHPDGSTGVLRLTNRAVRLWQLMHPDRPRSAVPPAFVSTADVSAEDQLAVLAAVAPWIDAGISKTVNLAPGASVAGTADLLHRAWASGIKGLTVFRPEARRPGVLVSAGASRPGCPRSLA